MKKDNFCCHCGYLPPESDWQWGTMLNWAGHQRTISKNYKFDNSADRFGGEFVLWQYTIDGCGMVKINGKEYPVAPGSAFLLNTPGKHFYYLPENPGFWEFLYIGLSGSEMIRWAEVLIEKYGPVSAGYGAERCVELAWQFIRNDESSNFSSPAEASLYAYDFLMSMVNKCALPSDDPGNDIVLLTHKYCLQHLTEDLSIDELAKHSGFSRSHFYRLFTEKCGRKPHEYVLDLRTRIAAQMLQSGNFSVKETASSCGFAETGYFCKVFRKIYGVTPAAFRDHRK